MSFATTLKVCTRKLAINSLRASRRTAARARNQGRIMFGPSNIVGPRLVISRGRVAVLGKRVHIASDVTIQTHLTVGDDVLISSRVAFIGDDHPFDDPNLKLTQSPARKPPTITLEGDNLIGYGTIILGGLTIGEGTIVGAGSLVTTSLPPNTICVGRPARPLRDRYQTEEDR